MKKCPKLRLRRLPNERWICEALTGFFKKTWKAADVIPCRTNGSIRNGRDAGIFTTYKPGEPSYRTTQKLTRGDAGDVRREVESLFGKM